MDSYQENPKVTSSNIIDFIKDRRNVVRAERFGGHNLCRAVNFEAAKELRNTYPGSSIFTLYTRTGPQIKRNPDNRVEHFVVVADTSDLGLIWVDGTGDQLMGNRSGESILFGSASDLQSLKDDVQNKIGGSNWQKYIPETEN